MRVGSSSRVGYTSDMSDEQAWVDEIVRQARELEAGTLKAIPWLEAKDDILAQLRKRRLVARA